MKNVRVLSAVSWARTISILALSLFVASCGVVIPGLWPRPTAQPEPDQEEVRVTLLAVGDINLGRKAGQIILDGDIDYAFEFVTDIISGADIAFGNLESTISEQDGETRSGTWRFTAPPDAALTLLHAGFDVLSLSNNHVWDYWERGLHETRDHLDAVGIAHTGTGSDLAEAYSPAVIEVNGLKVAFLAVANIFNYGVYPDHEAFDYTAWADMEYLAPAISAAREQVDLVVVSAHWDWEYKDYPSDATVELAHAIADAGADIILGHHPHVPQGIEIYNDTFIIYSLGNFAFHQTTKYSIWKKRSVILVLTLSRDGVEEYDLIPVTTGFQPAVAEGELADEILAHMEEISFTSLLFADVPTDAIEDAGETEDTWEIEGVDEAEIKSDGDGALSGEIVETVP